MENIYIDVRECGYTISEYFKNKDLISIDDLLTSFETLIDDFMELKSQYKDLQQDLEDNYVARPKSDYTSDSYDDRF